MKGNDRKQALFNAILSEYIKTAKPVGSKWIVEKCQIHCSPATVRNDMANLEQEGFIVSPHTSSGRVPTAKGYQYYIDNYLNKDIVLKEKYQNQIDSVAKDQAGENRLKSAAKEIAEISDQAVILALAENSFYYTGISNLFRKPEFQDVNIMYNLSGIIDEFDKVMANIYRDDKQINILIGDNNPFSNQCSIIFNGNLGILGPMRMDYQTNYSLIKYFNQLFK
ncbi:MAG: hypothetical protein V1898_03050 [Patescibacteria group bacterium]